TVPVASAVPVTAAATTIAATAAHRATTVPATTAHRSTTVPATATALRERITAHQHHRPESDSGQCNAELFHNDSFPSNPRSSVRRIAAETSSGLATRAVTRSAMIVR